MTANVTCGYTSSVWELNSRGETACQVYAQIQGLCDSSFIIQEAPNSTTPPYDTPNNACGCNVVAYNLMAGCGWCQSNIPNGWWLTINQWAGNCTQTQYNPTSLPASLDTASIDIPAWALAVPTGTTWNPAQASDIAVPPTSTATDIATGSTTRSTTRGFNTATGAFSGQDGFYNSSSSTNAGTAAGIAIGVILGLWALTLVVMIFVYVTRQNKRKAWYGPLAAFYQNKGNGGYGPGPGPNVPLMYSQGAPVTAPGAGYPTNSSPSNATTASGPTGYQVPPHPEVGGSQPPTGYVPPPPEPGYAGTPAASQAWSGSVAPTSVYGGTANTNSVYGGAGTVYNGGGGTVYGGPAHGSQTVLPQGQGQQATGPGGYRGHAEVY